MRHSTWLIVYIGLTALFLIATMQQPQILVTQRNMSNVVVKGGNGNISSNNDYAANSANSNNAENEKLNDHPLIRYRRGEIGLEEVPKLPVIFWPYQYQFQAEDKTIGKAAFVQIESEGVTQSSVLYRAFDRSDPSVSAVWIADQGEAKQTQEIFCHRLSEALKKEQERRLKQGRSDIYWPIFFVNFGDEPEFKRCISVEIAMTREYVFYNIRSIVKGRDYDATNDWVRIGNVMEQAQTQTQRADAGVSSFSHIPLSVRTDTVQSLQDVLQDRGMELDAPIEATETIPRPVDISHFWPIDTKKENLWKAHSMLRHKVSVVVDEMTKTSHPNLNAYVGLAGVGFRQGRKSVSDAYIKGLLDTKIVVVTQRDSFEDHYRLFEALVAGPMVLMDTMLSLPVGLEDGVSVVMFDSADDLRTKITYYLEHDQERIDIAKHGRHVAMSRHRSWHRMEEIVFGRPVTTCSPAFSPRSCPFVVHAKDYVVSKD